MICASDIPCLAGEARPGSPHTRPKGREAKVQEAQEVAANCARELFALSCREAGVLFATLSLQGSALNCNTAIPTCKLKGYPNL